MNRALRGLLFFVVAGLFSARPQTPATQQPAGLESDWDIAAVLQKIGAHAARVLPLLDRADAGAWKAKGAPAAYAAQLKSSKDQAHALVDDVKALSANPEALSGALQVLFREQGLETTLGSVVEAMRKYQSAEAAQQLTAVGAEAGADRDRLQRYVVNLAAEREKEYQVMDQEAQRCRSIVLGPATAAKKKK
jgi:hypothetical protein